MPAALVVLLVLLCFVAKAHRPVCSAISDIAGMTSWGGWKPNPDGNGGHWSSSLCKLPTTKVAWTHKLRHIWFVGDSTCKHLALAFVGYGEDLKPPESSPIPTVKARRPSPPSIIKLLKEISSGLLWDCSVARNYDRCQLMEALNLTRPTQWNPGKSGNHWSGFETPPVTYGREHPFCTDCRCVYTEAKCLNGTISVRYIPMDASKDIVLQTTASPTTQAALFQEYLSASKPQPDVIVLSVCRQDLDFYSPDQFGKNLFDLITMIKQAPLLRTPRIVWIRLLWLDEDRVPLQFVNSTNNARVRALNVAADAIMEHFNIPTLDAYGMAERDFWPPGSGVGRRLHSDAFHLGKFDWMFYGSMAQLISQIMNFWAIPKNRTKGG